MPFSARKMHFFEKNGNLTHCTAQHRTNVKELFFWEVILLQFLKQKNGALYSKNVQAILTLLNLAQKVPFLEDLKKKVPRAPHLDRAVWIRNHLDQTCLKNLIMCWTAVQWPAGEPRSKEEAVFLANLKRYFYTNFPLILML